VRTGGGDRELQQLARVARTDVDAACRAAAVAAMVAISPKGDTCPQSVIAVINECLDDPDPKVKKAASLALGLDMSPEIDTGAGLGPGGAYTWGPVAVDKQGSGRGNQGGEGGVMAATHVAQTSTHAAEPVSALDAGIRKQQQQQEHQKHQQQQQQHKGLEEVDTTQQAAVVRLKGNHAHKSGNYREARCVCVCVRACACVCVYICTHTYVFSQK
jgi:hypothetical protein